VRQPHHPEIAADMLYRFFGRVTQSVNLKEGLDASSQRSRIIADRVSKATLLQGDGFALPEVGAEPGSLQEGPVDLETEMVSLADEQLFYETTARLLQKAYEQVRSSIRER
jgi:hypothetical protein